MRIIDNRKIVAQYDDLTGGSAVRFYLTGNDRLAPENAETWAVVKYRRTTHGEVKVSTTCFTRQDHALAFFTEMIKTFSGGIEVRDVPDPRLHRHYA